MAHLPAGPRLALAIEMKMNARLADQPRPVLDFVADQIVHGCRSRGHGGRPQRQTANGPDMLLELRGFRAFDRPVTAVVHAGRDFVDHRSVCRREEFDSQHTDMAERLGQRQRGAAGRLDLGED